MQYSRKKTRVEIQVKKHYGTESLNALKTDFLSSTMEKTSIIQPQPLESSRNSCDCLNTL